MSNISELFEGWELNLAIDRETGEEYLVLAHLVSGDIRDLAKFVTPDAAKVFTAYMSNEGFITLPHPTEDDFNSLLDE